MKVWNVGRVQKRMRIEGKTFTERTREKKRQNDKNGKNRE